MFERGRQSRPLENKKKVFLLEFILNLEDYICHLKNVSTLPLFYLILTNLGFLLAVELLIFLLAGRQETTQI